MKEFLQLMRRFVSPYKKYAIGAVGLNILSAIFNVFSFSLLVPILNILFKTEGSDRVYEFMESIISIIMCRSLSSISDHLLPCCSLACSLPE